MNRDKTGAGRDKPANNQGFTLLEVLVATVILSLAYVAVLENFSQSMAHIFRLEQSQAKTIAAGLAFEGRLRESSASAATGEILTEGSKFRLIKISSEDGELISVKLEKR
ncbi:MAG: type II secretion system GspH family protein [Desulfobulbaceae bacterium]|nr:type II secretion system GspH family protein [Desulfobulbaceae bacterium]HIJ78343.1 type II secretion system protein [Deltaproteobacteria bacterium]